MSTAPKKQHMELAEYTPEAAMSHNQNLQQTPRKLIAPLWHTGLLLLLILAMTLFGAYAQRAASSDLPVGQQGGKAILYLPLIALQYGLLRLVIGGLRRNGYSLGDIIGRNDSSPRSVGYDLLIAAGFWTVGSGALAIIKLALGSVEYNASGLLPQSLIEIVLWVMVSVTAGFCEEVFYRGYLQRQFLALSGSVTVAILGQAIFFGISHSYQGVKSVGVITAYGVMFGLLAQWRRSLRPGMIAHAATDIISGLFKF